MTKEEFEEMVRFKLIGNPEEQVNEFIDYWTESTLTGKKMRFQGEKYFDINRRYATWVRVSKNFKSNESVSPIEGTLNARETVLKNMGLEGV